MDDVATAFKAIRDKQATFISRGDHSGTHLAELAHWNKDVGIDIEMDNGPWYTSIGRGMEATLYMASVNDGYVLSDRGTWIHFKNRGNLQILLEGDKRLFNQYGMILVNPNKHPNVKKELGQAFIDWLISPDAKRPSPTTRLRASSCFFRTPTIRTRELAVEPAGTRPVKG